MWLKLKDTNDIVRWINKAFLANKKLALIGLRKDWLSRALQRVFKKYAKKKSLSRAERTSNEARFCITMVANAMMEHKEGTAGGKLLAFFKDTADIHFLKIKFVKYHKRVCYVQRQIKEQLQLYQIRLEFL